MNHAERLALLLEMLTKAGDAWDMSGMKREGFFEAVEIVKTWAAMSDARPVITPQSLILGEASCEEKTS